MAEIIPYLFYQDVPAALDWLSRAFGFVETMREGTLRGGVHGEMTFEGGHIMMGQGKKEWRMQSAAATESATQGVFIYCDEVDAHCGRARQAGAEIFKEPEDLPYGRSYSARDLEGHPWFFTVKSKAEKV